MRKRGRMRKLPKRRRPKRKSKTTSKSIRLRLELGAKLIVLADPNRGGDLMKRISTVRATLATEMGVLLPMVRIKDRMSLPEYNYELEMSGNRIATGTLRPDRLLAIDTGLTKGAIIGDETTDPAFGKRAVWIDPRNRQQAELYGYQVVECGAVLATHVQETARKHADELLTREVTKQLIDQLKKTSATVVDELIPGQMKLADVQQVLQNLLREDIPIRQLSIILETSRRLHSSDQRPDLVDGICSAPIGENHFASLSRQHRRVASRNARPGDGRQNCGRHGTDRPWCLHSHVSGFHFEDLQSNCRPSTQARSTRQASMHRRQPKDSCAASSNHARSVTGSPSAELQRDFT